MRHRLAIVVCVAVPLAAIDLYVKSVVPTNPLYLHHRSGAWMILAAVVLLFMLLLTRLPSRFLAASAGVLAAGVLGNLISARLHHGLVPNPFVIINKDWVTAFNLADLFALAGIVLMTVAAMRVTVRYRHLLPQSSVAARLVRRVRSQRS